MAAIAAAFTSCEKEAIVGTADGEGLYLNKVELTLVKGNSEALVATLTPKGSAALKWTTEDKTIAKVDANGLVTAVGAGETVITAEAADMTVECLVKVQSLVTSVALDVTEIVIAKGAETEVTATVGPEDINVPFQYTWISSDETIFKVTPDSETPGKAVVKGLKGGFATLYVQAGDVTTSVPVTIDVDLAGIRIGGVPTDKIYEGDTFQLSVVKDPIDAIDELSPVWSSSDENIFTVDQTGLMTVTGVGTATITVESNGYTASVELSVSVMQTISFYPSTKEYQADQYLSVSLNTRYAPSYSYAYFYPNDSITFKVPEGLKIAKIEFKTYGNNSYPFEASVDSGTYDEDTLTWTGNVNQVTFTSTYNSTTYVTGLTVTYKN